MIKDHSRHLHELRRRMGDLIERAPETMKGFEALHVASMKEGALLTKQKELIALGIAIAVHCDGCIAYHVSDALKAGATAQEVLETIEVAILMGGGPALVYGCEAIEALDQFIILQDN